MVSFYSKISFTICGVDGANNPLPVVSTLWVGGSEAALGAFEYSIMMQQYEALLADYQRREAEEQAEKAKAQEGDGQA